jgi:predicted ArsR family transcriptional regulator
MTGKEKILKFLNEYGPATDDEIARKTRMNPSSARTRRHELELEGLVLPVAKSLTASGRQTWVWDIANRASLYYEERLRKTSPKVQIGS